MHLVAAIAVRKRSKFFYGWIIVAVATWLDGIAFSAGQAAFSVFLAPMGEDLKWSRTTLTGAVTLQSVVNIFVTPIVGVLIDRRGPRVIMVFGAVMAAIGYMLLGKVTEPWQFYAAYTLAAALGLAEVGQLVTSATVSKWFIRMRGRALAFAGIGNNIGAILTLPIIAFLIASVGWRYSWMVLGGAIAFLVIPPVLLFIRRTPEDIGLRPDGDPPDALPGDIAGSKPRVARVAEPQWGLREAMSHPTTWLLLAAFNITGISFNALVYHQVAYFMDAGLPLTEASVVLASTHVFTVCSKLFWGFISERFPVRYCLCICYVVRAISVLILLLGRVPERIYVYAVVSGSSQGIGPLSGKVWPDYYGRAFVGTIRGVLAPFSLFTSVGGPLYAALMYDLTGSYDIAFWTFAITMLIGAVMMYFCRPPVQRVQPNT